jgi:archaetidylinositol phosphate synthase
MASSTEEAAGTATGGDVREKTIPSPQRGNEPLQRRNEGLFQFLELPALRWLAISMPRWVTPDMLTGVGFLGGVVAAAGYALSAANPAMLWLASAGIALNWFGDSVDGTLARVRGIERPGYGFFIDNTTDILEYAVFAVGFGLSGYVCWELVLGTLAVFYAMMLFELIKARVTNVFQIAIAGVGLTEVRLGFIAVNAVMYWVPPQPLAIGGLSTTYPNILSALWIATQVVTFLVLMATTLRELALREPPVRLL